MSTNAIVRLQPGEDATRALKTLDRFLARSGAYQEIRSRVHYSKPSVKRRMKSIRARKREWKNAARRAAYERPDA